MLKNSPGYELGLYMYVIKSSEKPFDLHRIWSGDQSSSYPVEFFSCCLSRYICVRLHKTWWFGCVMWHLDHSFLCEGTLFKSNLLGYVNGYYMCMFRKKERLYWGPAPCMKSIWMTHTHTHTLTHVHVCIGLKSLAY